MVCSILLSAWSFDGLSLYSHTCILYVHSLFTIPLSHALSQVYRRCLVGNAWNTEYVEMLSGHKPRTYRAWLEENKALFA